MTRPERFADAAACANALIERLGGRVRLALPLGIGKPLRLVNALYQLARERPEISLDIFTALSLAAPRPGSELEARFLDPLLARLYGRVPALDYVADQRRGTLPDNVRLHEFYFRPGAALGISVAQQSYASSNYTHAARDLAARGVNVIAQMVAPASDAGRRYSLSCNPDLTADLLAALARRRSPAPLLVGEANPALPYLPGAAVEREAAQFDLLLEGPGVGYDLFPVPNRPVSLAEHAIGLRAAALVRDGGTLQIGIGGLGDALVAALVTRRRDNGRFRALLGALGAGAPAAELDDLPEGLYGCSELFVEGFLELHRLGVLRRTVDDGVFLHAGFFLGSAAFYQRLRSLDAAALHGIRMGPISFTNELFGNEEEKRRQRRHARFVNSAMMMSLLGAAVSDALEDGRVVSGVGGQYNFVAMGHALADGRSVLALPATRTTKGAVFSNIVWNYGHVTIPRHLRDLVVTEYGVADLRGAEDQDAIAAMLNLADSRFQESLRRRAVAAGKLPGRYRIPARFRNNTPQALRAALEQGGGLSALPWFPLGTDLSDVEAGIAVAMAALGEQRGNVRGLVSGILAGRGAGAEPWLEPALDRLGLAQPRGLRQRAYRALVAGALRRELRDAGRPLFAGDH